MRHAVRWSERALAAAALAVLAGVSGCARLTMAGTPRPARLAEWHACWLRSHELSPPAPEDVKDLGEKAGPRLSPGGPEHAVIVLHAKWAESWLRTEHVFGELTIAVKAPLAPGAVQNIEENSLGEYREGSLGWVEISPVTGTFKVLEADGDTVKAELSLIRKKDGIALADTVEAKAAADAHACYFGD